MDDFKKNDYVTVISPNAGFFTSHIGFIVQYVCEINYKSYDYLHLDKKRIFYKAPYNSSRNYNCICKIIENIELPDLIKDYKYIACSKNTIRKSTKEECDYFNLQYQEKNFKYLVIENYF